MKTQLQKNLKFMLDNSDNLVNNYDPVHYELKGQRHTYLIFAVYRGSSEKENKFSFHIQLPNNIVVEYDESEKIPRCFIEGCRKRLDRRSKKLAKELIKKVKPFINDAYFSWF